MAAVERSSASVAAVERSSASIAAVEGSSASVAAVEASSASVAAEEGALGLRGGRGRELPASVAARLLVQLPNLRPLAGRRLPPQRHWISGGPPPRSAAQSASTRRSPSPA
eukprot:CAMPEP_0115881826 /NCGR_PEP_ID=MMETSP0287-20121206/28661_1 /TAXON_ID=412157 /ORGANISM="Chrysochromulina rotalis, Strain UIO044" /LENGTH=110 /DNA_ID=CAMNT_0003337829 /DNA_START=242 /DNA_END=570 /DNA_ORIENTATION=-